MEYKDRGDRSITVREFKDYLREIISDLRYIESSDSTETPSISISYICGYGLEYDEKEHNITNKSKQRVEQFKTSTKFPHIRRILINFYEKWISMRKNIIERITVFCRHNKLYYEIDSLYTSSSKLQKYMTNDPILGSHNDVNYYVKRTENYLGEFIDDYLDSLTFPSYPFVDVDSYTMYEILSRRESLDSIQEIDLAIFRIFTKRKVILNTMKTVKGVNPMIQANILRLIISIKYIIPFLASISEKLYKSELDITAFHINKLFSFVNDPKDEECSSMSKESEDSSLLSETSYSDINDTPE